MCIDFLSTVSSIHPFFNLHLSSYLCIHLFHHLTATYLLIAVSPFIHPSSINIFVHAYFCSPSIHSYIHQLQHLEATLPMYLSIQLSMPHISLFLSTQLLTPPSTNIFLSSKVCIKLSNQSCPVVWRCRANPPTAWL